jgi:hypothetical protein
MNKIKYPTIAQGLIHRATLYACKYFAQLFKFFISKLIEVLWIHHYKIDTISSGQAANYQATRVDPSYLDL